MKLRIFRVQQDLGFVCALFQNQSLRLHAYQFAPERVDNHMITTHSATFRTGVLLNYAYFSKCVLLKIRTFVEQNTYFCVKNALFVKMRHSFKQQDS